ncbi:hypothetical protein AB0C51_14940 [Streptomyces pathocidini]|uniref:C2H2-type domain-containing protein n=1 Tax=Streptomyces pathocidini TaxID=1650571 RepID=A0ABW7USP3_9ACTN|nr:hypothetical protein [Streptomyces pathocidini]
MSEIADTPRGVPPLSRTARPEPPTHEAYSFACMRCGHGWEQEYEIRHHVDTEGRAYVTYHAGGERVPSPLTRPTCLNCDGHVVRIMRSGQIPTAAAGLAHQGIAGPLLPSEAPMAPTVTTAGGGSREAGGEAAARTGRNAPAPQRRHFSDLLHVFHRK